VIAVSGFYSWAGGFLAVVSEKSLVFLVSTAEVIALHSVAVDVGPVRHSTHMLAAWPAAAAALLLLLLLLLPQVSGCVGPLPGFPLQLLAAGAPTPTTLYCSNPLMTWDKPGRDPSSP
jgi:hypothetical protein